ncbi:SUKH-3 domain-containing protein [Nocardia sp. NPDC056000]|uniref:SUKH-3 domain-containing protein n=1 Tax=Nocardia sp. NPDC056000 TaxID=3345674 RepID=UPI0035DA0989
MDKEAKGRPVATVDQMRIWQIWGESEINKIKREHGGGAENVREGDGGMHSANTAEWLAAAGWTLARDIGSCAEDLIAIRVEDAARQGVSLDVIDPAVRFIHSYGDLELPLPGTSPERSLILKPTIGYRGDVDNFAELAHGLGLRVFPVAYETIEGSIWLIDETARFFVWHHTGGSFLGANEYEAFTASYTGVMLADAEDFFI